MGREVAQKWGFVGETHALNTVAVLPDFEDDLDHKIDVTLGIDTARDRQTDEIHFCCGSEHQPADLNAADATSC